MNKIEAKKLELVSYSDLSLLRVTTSFVESAALAFELGENETLSLTLAVEEIFVHLCNTIPFGDPIKINLTGKGYQVEIDFIFSSNEFDLRPFNIVCVADHAQAIECNDETGMIIASRMVDSFSIDHGGSKLKLKLVKEKNYPEIDYIPSSTPELSGELEIQDADAQQIKELIGLASVNYPKINLPESFRYPGKVVDMAIHGYYRIAVAIDETGVLGGGIIWRWESDRLVTFRGPFISPTCKDTDLATRLIDFLLEHVARTNVVGVLSSWPPSDLPIKLFEKLGSQFFFENDHKMEVSAYFRYLNEDPGSVIVVHPSLLDFVKKKYSELFLARHVEGLTYTGESKFAHSVISSKILRISSRAILRPIFFGVDATDNLRAHVRLLSGDGIPNIFFEMDLGVKNNSMFATALQECSFEPRLVIPLSGKSDTIIFQYIPGEMD